MSISVRAGSASCGRAPCPSSCPPARGLSALAFRAGLASCLLLWPLQVFLVLDADVLPDDRDDFVLGVSRVASPPPPDPGRPQRRVRGAGPGAAGAVEAAGGAARVSPARPALGFELLPWCYTGCSNSWV